MLQCHTSQLTDNQCVAWHLQVGTGNHRPAGVSSLWSAILGLGRGKHAASLQTAPSWKTVGAEGHTLTLSLCSGSEGLQQQRQGDTPVDSPLASAMPPCAPTREEAIRSSSMPGERCMICRHMSHPSAASPLHPVTPCMAPTIHHHMTGCMVRRRCNFDNTALHSPVGCLFSEPLTT